MFKSYIKIIHFIFTHFFSLFLHPVFPRENKLKKLIIPTYNNY